MSKGFLLDTHVLLWWLDDPEQKLSKQAYLAIADPKNAIYMSAAAAWEIGIKQGLGRLEISCNLAEVLQKDSIQVLPVLLAHGLAVGSLPLHHRDPFDRMMVVQAQALDLTLVTRDAAIRRYRVNTLVA